MTLEGEVVEIKEAGQLFENVMKETDFSMERCSTGIGNYVFIVTAGNNKFILRCSLEKDAYENSIAQYEPGYQIRRLSAGRNAFKQ